jgi:hypothetical protein
MANEAREIAVSHIEDDDNHPRKIVVDHIAKDDAKLVSMVKQKACIPQEMTVSLGDWKPGKNYEYAEPSVCAVLIQKRSSPGAVRVFSSSVINTVTKPSYVSKVILVIVNQPEDKCRLIGTPLVRWFTLSLTCAEYPAP